MIFVTVGTQLPFDRLIRLVDLLAASHETDFVAQIGDGDYRPEHLNWRKFYDPDEIEEFFEKADVIVSHAGMGTIINCIRKQKPIIIFPRSCSYGEHRNDHQMDTVDGFSDVRGVYPAKNDEELTRLLLEYDRLECPNGLDCPERRSLCSYLLSLA